VASVAYKRRRPDASVLYRIVHEHLETFRRQAEGLRDGEGLPTFVERAFRDFLRCGWLAGGFARFRCAACRLDRLVAFSCKGRAVCPSCGGRRMAERAAHLADRVLPDVPVRQWVLSMPYRLRYLLAWDHDLCRAVAAMLARALDRLLRERARDQGIEGGRSGSIIVVQRFGGALNLNVHFHALVLDGVFVREGSGAVRFHPVRRLTALDVNEALATVDGLVARRLRRRGLADREEDGDVSDPWADTQPTMAALAAGSVQGDGPFESARKVGADTSWRDDEADTAETGAPAGLVACGNGYSLHAGAVVAAGRRARLEEVCRYVLRPPVATERLSLADAGQVRLTLKQPWRDGTTAVVFEPVTFLARVAVLVPRPRVNLLLYYGVLGARSSWRAAVVGRGGVAGVDGGPSREGEAPAGGRTGNATWATLMRRVFGFDVLACPRCGWRLRLVAAITQAAVIGRMLAHLGEPIEIPQPWPARAPPDAWAVVD
jgi:hypothetical protein